MPKLLMAALVTFEIDEALEEYGADSVGEMIEKEQDLLENEHGYLGDQMDYYEYSIKVIVTEII